MHAARGLRGNKRAYSGAFPSAPMLDGQKQWQNQGLQAGCDLHNVLPFTLASSAAPAVAQGGIDKAYLVFVTMPLQCLMTILSICVRQCSMYHPLQSLFQLFDFVKGLKAWTAWLTGCKSGHAVAWASNQMHKFIEMHTFRR
jgi:hypothetical protein